MNEDLKDKVEEKVEEEITPETIIENLKANSVDKGQYDTLNKKYTELLKNLAERRTPEPTETPTDNTIKRTDRIKELRKELFEGEGFKGTNYEYSKKALELRELILETEGKDIFSNSASIASGSSDRAEVVAEHLKTLIKQAENTDSPAEAFTGLLKGSVTDSPKAKARR